MNFTEIKLFIFYYKNQLLLNQFLIYLTWQVRSNSQIINNFFGRVLICRYTNIFFFNFIIRHSMFIYFRAISWILLKSLSSVSKYKTLNRTRHSDWSSKCIFLIKYLPIYFLKFFTTVEWLYFDLKFYFVKKTHLYNSCQYEKFSCL